MDEDSGILSIENTAWLEKEILHGLRLWYSDEFGGFFEALIFDRFSFDRHVIGIIMFSILCIIVLLCCCFRFRIPR